MIKVIYNLFALICLAICAILGGLMYLVSSLCILMKEVPFSKRSKAKFRKLNKTFKSMFLDEEKAE